MAAESMRNMRRLCVLAASMLLAAPLATASNALIYKWRAGNGSMVYSESPPRNSTASKVGTLVVEPVPPAQQRAAANELARLKAEADAMKNQRRLQDADERVDAAIRALQAAEADLRAGSVPSGNERIENFGGQAALRESYLNRLSELQARVGLARQTLDEANALRRSL